MLVNTMNLKQTIRVTGATLGMLASIGGAAYYSEQWQEQVNMIARNKKRNPEIVRIYDLEHKITEMKPDLTALQNGEYGALINEYDRLKTDERVAKALETDKELKNKCVAPAAKMYASFFAGMWCDLYLLYSLSKRSNNKRGESR